MSFIGDLFGGGDEVTTVAQTSMSEPPAYALPHLTRVMTEGHNLFKQPRSFFPGKTYIDFSAPTLAGLGAGEARAVAGNPLIDKAQSAVSGAMNFANPASGYLQKATAGNFLNPDSPYASLTGYTNPAAARLTETARGDFLNAGNPYLDAALQPVIDRVQGQYSRAGRLGSGANVGAITSALAPAYAQNFEAERARQEAAKSALANIADNEARTRLAAMGGLTQAGQFERAQQAAAAGRLGDLANQQQLSRMAAAAMAPGTAAADYDDINRLVGYGAAREAKAGEALRDQMARHDFLQNEASQRLAEYAALTRGGTVGSTGTTNTPYFSNPTQQGLGNLADVAAIGKTAYDAGFFDWLGSLGGP